MDDRRYDATAKNVGGDAYEQTCINFNTWFFLAILLPMKRMLFAAILFALPLSVSAVGFAKQSIFLSTSAPVEGQTVTIYASVSNPATTTFNGTLVIKDGASEIGSVPVSLKAGGADTASVSWKPTAGSHTIVADLQDANGKSIEEDKEAFIIAAAPSATAASSANPFGVSNAQIGDVQPSTPIQESIQSVSPAIAEYSSPVLEVIDSGRTFVAEKLNTALNWSKSQVATSSKAAASIGATEEEKGSLMQTAWRILATVALYVVTILLYIVTNVGVFYPILAIGFLYTLWRLWRKYRRGY
ncbi:hypothetical protein A2389_00305 [Candidatus Adlerbacteria bacterium RIFOXYB1_FULL_48_10]|nr:MAG: hypothetical protein A2389_00305 [Candidatus Adlerbacteria bacterium RIFOXYB1_FULL_48_10]